MSVEEEKSEVLRRSIPFGRIAELASAPESTIWPTDISAYFGGRGVAADKARRIRAAAAKLIDLYDSVLVKPNWRSPENVRTALAKLAAVRANSATAPWQSRSAETPFAEGQQTSTARATLSGTHSLQQ